MNQIKALIIEDEYAAVDVIKLLLNQFASDIVVAGYANNGLDALQKIADIKPDLIFLDVDMPQLNGIEVIHRSLSREFEIIFTTGSTSHALHAIKLDAADYLLKPIGPADFIIAIEKARKRINVKNNTKKGITKIQLPTQNGFIYIEENDIIHISGMGSYCNIITSNANDKILISRSIGYMEEKLSSKFFRCHNSHLINLDHVAKFVSREGNFIILKNGTSVEVSRRNKEALLKKLNTHVT